jgi:hypothetical protein
MLWTVLLLAFGVAFRRVLFARVAGMEGSAVSAMNPPLWTLMPLVLIAVLALFQTVRWMRGRRAQAA